MNAPARVLVVNPSGVEELGLLAEPLEKAHAQWDEVVTQSVSQAIRTREGVQIVSSLPQSCGDYDCLILLGAPVSMRGAKSFLGIAEEIQLLLRAFQSEGRPILGTGFGAQLIAKALGGSIVKLTSDSKHTALPSSLESQPASPMGIEFGWHSLDFTAEAWKDKLISEALRTMLLRGALPSGSGAVSIKFFQWHCDAFQLPPGAVSLCTRSTCPSQAFRFGLGCYAFQFHLEVGQDLADRWCVKFVNGRDRGVLDDDDTMDDSGLCSDVCCESLREELRSEVQRGTVRRAEAFVSSFIEGWLDLAIASRPSVQHSTAGDFRERSRSRSPCRAREDNGSFHEGMTIET